MDHDYFDIAEISCAASEGHYSVIQEMISSSSNVSELLQAKDINGNTPLHFAAYYKQ